MNNLELVIKYNKIIKIIFKVYYIVKYIAKEESVMIRPEIQEAIHAVKEADSSKFVSKLIKLTNMLMARRERSAQEVAFLVCGLNLRGSNHTVVFINTHQRESRARMLKKECLNNETDQIFEENDFTSDIHDKYKRRPRALENLCLAEFAQWWKVEIRKKSNELIEGDSNSSDEEQNYSRLSFMDSTLTHETCTYIIKRKKPAVIKTPFISHVSNPDAYYYSLILLYLLFRIENELLGNHTNSCQCYREIYNHLKPMINPEMLKRQEELRSAMDRLKLFDEIEGQETNNGNVEDEEAADENFEQDISVDIPTLPQLVDEDNMNTRIRSLNSGQRTAFNSIRNHIFNGGNEPLFYCLHGSGGTGKSYIARIVIDMINLQYNHNMVPSISKNVLVAAPTGVAAKNIKGVTCHSAFSLPIEKFKLGEYLKLKGKKLAMLRTKFTRTRWLIIDEISMISYQVLRQINLRCQEIKEVYDKHFGNLNVILMGDLLQIKPVQGTWIYKQPKDLKHEPHLWRLFEIHQLTENVRQNGNIGT